MSKRETFEKWQSYLVEKELWAKLSLKAWVRIMAATRNYSFRFDNYLNALIRYGTYSVDSLMHDFETDTAGKPWPRAAIADYAGQIADENEMLRSICTDDSMDTLPTQFKGRTTYADLLSYVEKINKMVQTTYKTFIHYSFPIKREMILYRGVSSPDQSKFQTEWVGFTSTSYKFEIALDFAKTQADAKNQYAQIYTVRVPAETRILPIELCSRWSEHEVVVVSQGVVDIISTTTEEDDDDGWNITFINCQFSITHDVPSSPKSITPPGLHLFDKKFGYND